MLKLRKEEIFAEIDYNESRELIYGMPYAEWKSKFQTEASKEQLEKLNKKEN